MKVAVVLILVVASIMVSAAGKGKKGGVSEADGEKQYESCLEKTVGSKKSVDAAGLKKIEGTCAESLKKSMNLDKITGPLLAALQKVNGAAEGAVKGGGSGVKEIVANMRGAFAKITKNLKAK